MITSSPAAHGRTQPHFSRVKKKPHQKAIWQTPSAEYGGLIGGIAELLEAARRTAARTVNALMTATYWDIGRRIVEHEQRGEERAAYGEQLLARLSADLTARFGWGFAVDNLERFRAFFLSYPPKTISATLSRKSAQRNQTTPSLESSGEKRATMSLKSGEVTIRQTVSGKSFASADLAAAFPLPWSQYVRLLSVKNALAREFYHAEALRGGWSVRQLDRQIASQFYERTALSRNKKAMLRKGEVASVGDSISADEEVRDPLVLEFLGLKDEYSETDLEEALLRHLESFLLELGENFAFHRSPTPAADWRRMVSRRSSFLSPQTAVPRRHRFEGWEVHARRCRPNASLPQLRPRALDSAGRKSAGRIDSLRGKG